MTRKDIVNTYGQNVYDIRLEIATALFISGAYSPEEAFTEAEEFIEYMESEQHQKLE